MIKINKDSATNQLVYQANDADRTHWLIVATSVLSCAEKVFIIELTNLSTKCLKFVITDNETEDALLATMDFPSGDWSFDFYKQPLATQSTNLDRLLATLEFTKTGEVLGTSCPSQSSPAVCPPVTITDGIEIVEVGAGGEYTCDIPVCADAVYENSDQSFQQNIVSGATFVADDVVNVDSDGSNVPTPANIAFAATLCTGVTPSGIAYQRPQLTGQETSYSLHDDAWQVQNGIRGYTPPANPEQIAQLDTTSLHPNITMKQNNFFGNLERFTGTTGGFQDLALDYFDKDGIATTEALAFPNSIVVCNLTGLAFTRTIQNINTNWATTLTNANGSSFGGESDWFLPDAEICYSLQWFDVTITGGSGFTLKFPPFNLTAYSSIWSSTTSSSFTSQAMIWGTGEMRNSVKTGTSVESLYYRNHFN